MSDLHTLLSWCFERPLLIILIFMAIVLGSMLLGLLGALFK